MTKQLLTAYINGVGLLGPGLNDWSSSQSILVGKQAYEKQATVLPLPTTLPAAERRRSGAQVRLTLATGLEAVAAAQLDAALIPCVYTASGGDGQNCHEICQTLASGDRLISPTRFHNSVHNAATGYWGIATGAMLPISALCAHDASFSAGLLEALCQVVADNVTTLLIASDAPYPEPLQGVRPISDALGISLVLSPTANQHSLAKIEVSLTCELADNLENPELETLRLAIPAARGLPLLTALCAFQQDQQPKHIILDYFDHVRIAVDISAC